MDSPDRATLEKTFAYHRPSAAGLEHIARLREIYSVAKRAIEAECPPSRERAVDRGGDDQC